MDGTEDSFCHAISNHINNINCECGGGPWSENLGGSNFQKRGGGR
jgi:hypothetical protein